MPSSKSLFPNIHPAQQTRSRATRDRIVQAFEQLLKEKPFDQITVQQLAKRAEVSVGSVYSRFKNKDALIPVVFELYNDRLQSWAANEGQLEIPETAGLRDVIDLLVNAVWQMLSKDAHILRTAHLWARIRPEAVGNEEIWDSWKQAAEAVFPPILAAFADEIKRPDLLVAAQMATYFINAFFLEFGLYPDESPANIITMSQENFVRESADFLYAYLTLPSR